MSKEDLLSLLAYGLALGVAIVLGFTLIIPTFREVEGTVLGMPQMLFMVLCILVSFLLNVILLEVSHVIGALISGYEIVYVNVLGFCIYKDSDTKKMKAKFPVNFDGLTGETKVLPKSENAKPNMIVLVPFVVIILEALLLIVSSVILNNSSDNSFLWVKLFMLVLTTFGAMLFIYNYFPAKIDSITDGYKMVIFSKKENVDMYNKMLILEDNIRKNSKAFNIETINENSDLSATFNCAVIQHETRNKNYIKVLELAENIINNQKVSRESLYFAQCSKLLVLLNDDLNKAKDFYNSLEENAKKYIKSRFSLFTIKTAILYFGLIEKADSEITYQLDKVKKHLLLYSEDSKKIEVSEINEILTKIKEKEKSIDLTFEL